MLGNYDSTRTSKRVRKKVLGDKLVNKVANKISSYTGKALLRNELEGLVGYMREIDYNLLKNDSEHTVVDKIARNFYKQLNAKNNSIIDTHEVLKRQIGTIPNDGPHSVYNKSDCSPYQPTFGMKDPSVSSIIGDRGQNSKYSESFGSRARNTDEDNQKYGDNDVAGVLANIGLGGNDRTQQLENQAMTFSSVRDKYPRIAKQKFQNLYLLLDSKNRNLSTDRSVFKWTVLNTANNVQGTVNTLSDQIHNIVNIQFDRINIPYVPSGDNIYRKISLFIEEFASMSVLTGNGRRYHMLFDSEIQGNQFQLTPLVNDEGRFRFSTPINILDTITIKFSSPFSPVEFLKDRYDITIQPLNPTQSVLTFNEEHNVADGELVHLERFDTLDPVTDFNTITLVNREQGHIVTFINNLQLRVDIDLTSITSDVNNLTTCFIASRRLIIPIRMEYIMQ